MYEQVRPKKEITSQEQTKDEIPPQFTRKRGGFIFVGALPSPRTPEGKEFFQRLKDAREQAKRSSSISQNEAEGIPLPTPESGPLNNSIEDRQLGVVSEDPEGKAQHDFKNDSCYGEL